MGVAFGNAAVLADHALAVLHRQAEGRGQRLGGPGGVFAHHVHAFEDAAHQARDDVRMVAVEVVAHRPDVGDQVVGGAGGHHQARALQLVRHGVDVRRPADERVEARVLHEDLRRRRRVGRPFEVDVARVDAGVDEQRHDQVMAGRVLGQHDLLALAVLASGNR